MRSSTAKVRTRFARVALAVGSVVLLVACLELLTLIGGDYRALFSVVEDFRHAYFNRYDHELLHVRVPNTEYQGVQRESGLTRAMTIPPEAVTVAQLDLRWDRNGFRNDRDILEADIAVVGDSFVEHPAIASDRLATSVISRHGDFEVVNLGQSGYGPQQELAVLRRYAMPCKPKVVVWTFFEGNDLTDALEYERVAPQWESLSRQERSFWKRSFTRNVIFRARAQAAAIGWLASPEKMDGDQRMGILPDGARQWFLYPGRPRNSEEQRALAIVRRVLTDAAEICEAHGARLLVVFIPTKFRVLKDKCRFEPGADCARWELNDLPGRLRSIVEGLPADVAYLDLTPALENAPADGSPVYIPDDTHWTIEGHRIAGEAIATFLKSWATSPQGVETSDPSASR